MTPDLDGLLGDFFNGLLVSLIRKDFEELSDLLLKAAREQDERLPRLDRIVLYIDDLDRCKAERVIEVLEAVHLLLAFPLFAVVVAVDPRWLRQSLLDHYPSLLGCVPRKEGGLAPTTEERATPQDYLEKIFQVPFNLQAMQQDGFNALVEHLFPVKVSGFQSEPKSDNSRSSHEPRPIGAPPEGSSTAGDPVSLSNEPEVEAHEVQQPLQPGEFAHPVGSFSSSSPTFPAKPQRLTLTQNEVDDVRRLQPLFRTPRALKRFANTYSLIRVGVSESDWAEYLGDRAKPGEYRIPLLLLAVTSAFPSLARPWLAQLIEQPPDDWKLDKADVAVLTNRDGVHGENAEWSRLVGALNSLDIEGWPGPREAFMGVWAPRVARYSF